MRTAKPRGRSMQGPLFKNTKRTFPAPKTPTSLQNKQKKTTTTIIASIFVDCYLQFSLRHHSFYCGAFLSFFCVCWTNLPGSACAAAKGCARSLQHVLVAAASSAMWGWFRWCLRSWRDLPVEGNVAKSVFLPPSPSLSTLPQHLRATRSKNNVPEKSRAVPDEQCSWNRVSSW